jgi:hypothetical protein
VVLIKQVEKIQVWLKSGKNNTQVHENIRTFITNFVTEVTLLPSTVIYNEQYHSAVVPHTIYSMHNQGK